MYGQIVPQSAFGFGVDNYTDIGFDSQYQYDGDKFSVTVKLTDILEYQKLNASSNLAIRRVRFEPQRPAQQLQGQRVVRVGSHLQSSAPAISTCREQADANLYGGSGSAPPAAPTATA